MSRKKSGRQHDLMADPDRLQKAFGMTVLTGDVPPRAAKPDPTQGSAKAAESCYVESSSAETWRNEPNSQPTESDSRLCGHSVMLNRLRRDLHDQVGSSLAGMALQLEVAAHCTTDDQESSHELLNRLSQEVSELVGQVRGLVSPCRQCSVGSDLGVALTTMTNRMNKALSGRLHVELDLVFGPYKVPEQIGSATFWIIREALANVIKHSDASECTVSVELSRGQLCAHVRDSGNGRPNTKPTSGLGLKNMYERAKEHGGTFVAESGSKQGFAVTVVFPVFGRPSAVEGVS